MLQKTQLIDRFLRKQLLTIELVLAGNRLIMQHIQNHLNTFAGHYYKIHERCKIFI